MRRERQACGAYPTVLMPVPVPVPMSMPGDDRYLELGALHDLRLRRLAHGTGPVRIIDRDGFMAADEDKP